MLIMIIVQDTIRGRPNIHILTIKMAKNGINKRIILIMGKATRISNKVSPTIRIGIVIRIQRSSTNRGGISRRNSEPEEMPGSMILSETMDREEAVFNGAPMISTIKNTKNMKENSTDNKRNTSNNREKTRKEPDKTRVEPTKQLSKQ